MPVVQERDRLVLQIETTQGIIWLQKLQSYRHI